MVERILREAAKKVLPLMAGPLRGGEYRAGTLKKKNMYQRFNGHQARGGGGYALMARPLREELFCGFPKTIHQNQEIFILSFVG